MLLKCLRPLRWNEKLSYHPTLHNIHHMYMFRLLHVTLIWRLQRNCFNYLLCFEPYRFNTRATTGRYGTYLHIYYLHTHPQCWFTCLWLPFGMTVWTSPYIWLKCIHWVEIYIFMAHMYSFSGNPYIYDSHYQLSGYPHIYDSYVPID